ncbi:MAG TPA: hypothetical protein VGJ48_15065 [Pyrinomonadaceae bacterium]
MRPRQDSSEAGYVSRYTQHPVDFTVGTLTQLASARPFNSTTGVDNNGDGTTTNAIPAFANIDPPRMFQMQARFIF